MVGPNLIIALGRREDLPHILRWLSTPFLKYFTNDFFHIAELYIDSVVFMWEKQTALQNLLVCALFG